ncbi:MAG: sensor domain-containing diguanylate cyclase [Elusimicrobiota bacterium]
MDTDYILIFLRKSASSLHTIRNPTMLNKYLVSQFLLPVICGLFSIYFLYNSAIQTVNIRYIFPVFIFFLFILYFLSDQVLAGIFFIFYLAVGFLALIFSNGFDRIIVLLEIGYLIAIFILADRFLNTFSEKCAILKEETENLHSKLNNAVKTSKELVKKEDGLKIQLANYKSITDIIQNVSATFDTKIIETSIVDSIKRFIPKGSVELFFNKNNDRIITDIFDKNIMLKIDDMNYSQYRDTPVNFRSCIAVPFINEGQTFAVATVKSDTAYNFNDSDLRMLSVLADIFSLGYINAQLYKKTEELAITDGLTGLFVHSYFIEILSGNVSTAKYSKTNLSLIMLDIDNFKDFNDRFGHEAGDAVLKFVADSIRANTRETDIIARYGGEEFVILLPYTKLNDAKAIAERTRKWIYTKEINFNNNILKITASFGVCEYKCSPDFSQGERSETEDFINNCDINLYTAKKRGKNCVV